VPLRELQAEERQMNKMENLPQQRIELIAKDPAWLNYADTKAMAQELLERRERAKQLEAENTELHSFVELVRVTDVAALIAEIAELRRDRDRLVDAHRGLRRRVHMLEAHNQHFERCESAWCNPGPENDPASELGKPDKWPFGEDAAMTPKKEQP